MPTVTESTPVTTGTRTQRITVLRDGVIELLKSFPENTLMRIHNLPPTDRVEGHVMICFETPVLAKPKSNIKDW